MHTHSFFYRFLQTLGAAVLAATITTAALAQNLTGTINGTVRDESGAVIPNAAVTITDSGTGVVARRLQTNGSGRYEAPSLQQGIYTVQVTIPGFETVVVKQIKLNVDQALPVDATMHVGVVTAQVEVTEDQLVVDTEDNAAETTIEGKEVTDLPLGQRNFVQLLQLQPGVNAGIGTIPRGPTNVSGGNNQVTFSVQGQAHTANGFFFDGVDFLNHDTNLILGAYPSIDAIAQVNLLRAGYGAQYSGNGAAIVNLVSRTGTNQLHGTAYFFLRNQNLNANPYFNNLAGIARQPFRYNNFGFSVGGPVLLPFVSKERIKTYFFVSGEYLRTAQPTTTTNTNIPTQAERNGIFSAPVCISYNASGSCTASSTTVKNIDPTAAAYLKDVINKLPLPNSPTDAHGLIASLNGTLNENQTLVRIDHTFNAKWSAFFRYLNDPYDQVAPEGIGASGESIPDLATTQGTAGASNYLGNVTWSPTSTWVINGGLSYLHSYVYANIIGLLAKTNAPDFQPELPYANTSTRISTVSINGTSLKAPGPLNRVNDIVQGFINGSKAIGNHTIMFGTNIERFRSNYQTLSSTPGTFTFKAPASAGNALAIYNQSFADFLIGYTTSFSQSSPDGNDLINASMYEGYLQDNFKVGAHLTVNLGVRYTFFRQATNELLPIVNFDPALYSAGNAPTIDTNGNICAKSPCSGGVPYKTYSATNGLLIAGTGGPYGRKTVSQPKLDFAPRFGFVYSPFASNHTAIRAGYGIYYLLPDVWENLVNQASTNPPFIQSTSATNTSFGAPNGGVPSAASAAPAPNALYATGIQEPLSYLEAFNLDVQQELPQHLLLDVGYYGNVGRKLIATFDINQPLPGAYVVAGIAAPGAISSGNSTTKLNRIRPYLGYASIADNLPIASGNYNSLQVAAKKEFRYGSEVGIAYTWSKSMGIEGAQNFYNIAGDYGPTDDQRNHIIAAQGVYETPWFHEQRGLVGHLLGGYELSTIVNFLSGAVHTASTSGVDPAGLALLNSNAASARPDQVGNPNNGPKTFMQYFNAAAFALVPALQVRSGNAAVNSIYGPNSTSVTLGLMRNIRIHDTAQLQLRAEAFNVFNHTSFNGVSTTVASTNYGQLTSAGDPRIMQLAAKFIF
jgi:carboxypeptidase family protein/TonB-dependent receptor-like protein